ncbi:MAG: hypothetical protein ABIE74_08105 [Pseudomonadota bacterium]
MRKIIIVCMVMTIVFSMFYGFAEAGKYPPRNRPPVAVINPKSRPAGWCANHPKKCSRIKTDTNRCWDLNNDGYLDDYELSERNKHPNRCPGK